MSDSVGNNRDAAQAGTPVSIADILRQISLHKRILLSFPATFLLLAFAYLQFAEYRYAVNIQVTQVTSASSGGTETLGAIAAAAGLNIPGTANEGAQAFELFIQSLYTRDTAAALASDLPLMRALFPQEWDTYAGKWRDPHRWWNAAVDAVAGIAGAPVKAWEPPNADRVQDFIVKNVTVSRDMRNPIVTIQILYPDPTAAKWFLTPLHHVDDENLRHISLARTSKYIEYLSGEIQNVAVGDYRDALVNQMAAQEKRRMFASSSVAYAAQIFQMATASPEPIDPDARLLAALSVIVGSLLGALFAYGWHHRKSAV